MTAMVKRRPARHAKPNVKRAFHKAGLPIPKLSVRKPAKPKKALAQLNRWMEDNIDVAMRVARKNTLRFKSKEAL